jgi:hypothetical protein
MKQKAICVAPIPLQDTKLDITELQQALDDGWLVAFTEASDVGSILVIIQKAE